MPGKVLSYILNAMAPIGIFKSEKEPFKDIKTSNNLWFYLKLEAFYC